MGCDLQLVLAVMRPRPVEAPPEEPAESAEGTEAE
jgi:hypothetical protein